ncbi:Sialic acid TRAP transporter permease protein SiaT [Lentibacillus sp. JNUCC-1]|uniref:TRAP transporter large permease n=1 Tax=Lentibacillus sp. JNUCC-1 TaxID=2654513 RepID=UPI0012E78F26|nr:TRAP transporter large permease subunit [Lentibacillus sp. JNUCC-1]MUV37148.1 Sialic acid TRAP transporter permease protein SiaT [Lentibacillus sp. JNUCC-1]
MAVIYLLALLFLFMFLQVPLAISIGLSSMIMLLVDGFSLDTIALRMFTGVDKPVLMAVPGFIFAGLIMARGGMAKYLFEVMNAWIGHTRGGLSTVAILVSLIFAAISGSSAATAVAVGSIMIPVMTKAGYDKKYAAGLVATAGTLGILVPPSVPLILYGSIAEISVKGLFTAALIPAALLATALIIFSIVVAIRKGYGGLEKASWETRIKASKKAIWGLLFPVIILGSIYGGIATPTEASFIAVLYAFIISKYVYKEIDWKNFRDIVISSVNTTAMIFLIIASASLLGVFLSLEQIPQTFAAWIGSNFDSTIMFLLLVSLMLFVLGMFLDATAMLMITLPIFLPILATLDINLFFFAVIMVVTMELGMITPPLGMNLFVVSGVSGLKIESILKGVLPFYALLIIVLLILIFIPQLSLWLL